MFLPAVVRQVSRYGQGMYKPGRTGPIRLAVAGFGRIQFANMMDCLTAAQAARFTGRFHLHADAAQAAVQRAALRECRRLEQEAARLRTQAAKERQIARQVDLNLALQRLQADLNAARARL